MIKLKYFAKAFGLHPLTALAMFVVDWMLFGEEVATGGVGWVLSLPVGVLLGLFAVLIQRRLFNDESRPAIAKGVIVAVLTAIPAPLSSLGLLPLAAFGAVKVLFRDRSSTKPALELQTGQDIVRSWKPAQETSSGL
jgi:hypothetical protein